jgi:hypothetical protein
MINNSVRTGNNNACMFESCKISVPVVTFISSLVTQDLSAVNFCFLLVNKMLVYNCND